MSRGDLLCRLAVMCPPNVYGVSRWFLSLRVQDQGAFLETSQSFPSLAFASYVPQMKVVYEMGLHL